MITAQKLQEIFPNTKPSVIQNYIEPLNATFDKFNINTVIRQAAFLAQIGHESGGFVYTKELWGPTDAQVRYEGRADLGNIHPGDGRRYLGRGLIQITGRANYAKCGEAMGLNLVVEPELLERPDMATESAGWYWKSRGCNVPADIGDVERVTKLINGGLNGLAQRLDIYARALKALT